MRPGWAVGDGVCHSFMLPLGSVTLAPAEFNWQNTHKEGSNANKKNKSLSNTPKEVEKMLVHLCVDCRTYPFCNTLQAQALDDSRLKVEVQCNG